jgi:hypothetical protein
MVDKSPFRIRGFAAEDVEIVASFEREIAKISFPDDPIVDLDFYKKNSPDWSITRMRQRSSQPTAADPRVRACAGAPDNRRAAVAAFRASPTKLKSL